MCAKHPFKSFTDARKVGQKQHRTNMARGRTTHPAVPYHCTECGAFHLTSHPRTNRSN